MPDPTRIRPSLKEAVHVALGSFHLPGARDYIHLTDRLSLGPCHGDPLRHHEVRIEFWSSFESPRRGATKISKREREELAARILTPEQFAMALARFPETKPVVLWTSLNWYERLQLWWLFDAIRTCRLNHERFWVAESSYPESADGVVDPLAAHTPRMLEAAFDAITPLSRATTRDGASLWRKFVDTSPMALTRAGRQRPQGDPERKVITDLYRWGLPRVFAEESSRLRLSEFDQALLGRLSRSEWVRALDAMMKIVRDDASRAIYHLYGDLSLVIRLRTWSSQRPDDPVIIALPSADAANTLYQTSYRLTARRQRLLKSGLERIDEAPPFFIGGCHAYSGNRPWVRRLDRDGWEVSRFR